MPTKELFVVGGPNGAGKSTYAAEFLKRYPCPYLSTDAIAAELAPADPASQQFAAGREFLVRIEAQLLSGTDWLVETTLSGRSFRNTMAKARAARFRTTVVFVYVDSADISLARVHERVRKGGHDVPEDDVRRRFSRTFSNFWHVYGEIADYWHVVYNSGIAFHEVAVGEPHATTVRDEPLFRRFLQLAGANYP
jgi:predicted ABC-type ATPase